MIESALDSWPSDAVEVGRVLGAWGVKGWIKIQPFAAQPQAFFSSKRWYVQAPSERPGPVHVRSGANASHSTQAGAALASPAGPVLPYPALLKVQQAKEHGGAVVAQIAGLQDRTQAEALRGARLFVSRASFPTPDAEEFYWVDLIGARVVNREGQCLGVVADLLDTGPHSVLRITPEGKDAADEASQRLIPFVKAYIDEVNLAERRISVDWGLDY
jgi:16S rRNA processing protein RimM